MSTRAGMLSGDYSSGMLERPHAIVAGLVLDLG
jgi:hypothetical protein